MIIKAAIGCALAFGALSCSAQTANREAQFSRIEAAHRGVNLAGAMTPLVDQFTEAARARNPGVPEASWQSVRADFRAAITQAMLKDGGALSAWVRTNLDALSDDELARYATVLEDPVYVKAQAQLATSSALAQYVRLIPTYGQLIAASLNDVLARRGLNQVR